MRSKDTVVVVVGAGAAGITAAIGLAKRNIPVVVVEGAPYPGAENWSGAVYFCENLVRPEILGPGALDTAAVERRVVKRGLLLADGRTAVGGAVRSREAFRDCYTVLRPVFDHDLAAKARLLGAEILSSTTALGLIRDGDRVHGVLTDRGPIYADLVFLAEGDASRLVTREGLETKAARPGRPPEPEFLQGVKEVLALDPREIERRFGVGAGEGACYEILLENGTFDGRPFPLNAGAFLYTNRDSISLGFVAPLANLRGLETDHNRLMERLKALPFLRELIGGATPRSFGAKLIRGGGYREMPKLALDGLVVGGAAAGLGVDFPCPNYTGPATYSGFLVSEAAAKIRAANRAFDAGALDEHYVKPLLASHYVADTKSLADWPHFVATAKEFFGRQARLAAGTAHVATACEFGVVERHLLIARRLVEILPPKKAGPFLAEMRAAGDALGFTRGLGAAFVRALPRLALNCVLGFLPAKAKTGAAFEPVFLADPDPLRRPAPWSVRFLRARFRGAAADALFHLYRNDPTPVAEKTAAARDALLGRLSLLDLLLLPFFVVLNYALGYAHRLGFLAWVAATKPSLDRILATPFFRLQEEERRALDLARAPTVVPHDDKLAQITYRGEERGHIKFHVGYEASTGLPVASSPVFHVCPARVYRDERDQSLAVSVAVLHENCIKCETCWRADPERVDWGRTRTQRLVFEAYSPADAWLRESLEAAALAELGRAPEIVARRNDPPAPPLVTLDPARRAEVVALLTRVRRAARGFRPLHDGLPAVLFGADQELLGRTVDDAVAALEALDAAVRPAADVGLWARLDAVREFLKLVAPRRAARRFFDLETDFALLEETHLPDLEARLGVAPETPASPRVDTRRARRELRLALEAKLGKDAAAACERAGRPVGAAAEALRGALRETLRRGERGADGRLGGAARDLLLEELARLAPALAVAAHAHLAAADVCAAASTADDPEDLAEVRRSLARATPAAAYVDGVFTRDADGLLRGETVACLAGAPVFVVPLSDGVAVVGAADAGVIVEAPGALGLLGAGPARLRLDGARPRAVFGGVDAAALVQTSSAADVVAIARGAAEYAAERALDHAESRVQFPGLFRDVRGRDGIAKFGAVQAMLAGIETSRLVLEALRGAPFHGALGAALATELLGPGPRSVVYLAGQALGGTAYSEEDPICRLFRDAACLGRRPFDARATFRRHGRRQLKLVRGGAGKEGDLVVGLDLRPVSFADLPLDPPEMRRELAALRAAVQGLNRAADVLDAESAEAVAADLGRWAALAGGFDRLLAAAREARAGSGPDPRLEAAWERLAGRVAARAERLVRRFADVPELVALGRLALKDGVTEGRAYVSSAAGVDYGAFLAAPETFKSGDLVAAPGVAGELCWTPELLEADPLLGPFHDETVAKYRARWRDRLFDGLPYPRHVEKLHHVPLADLRTLLEDGAFRRVIPDRLGGLGWKKAKYYVDCVAMMRHGDPAQPLIVMGSTSIGTTPILLGLEQDLPAAEKAASELLANPGRVAAIADAVRGVRRLLDGPRAAEAKAPFEKLVADAKKALLSDKALRLVFQEFGEALTDAGRAGLKRDLAGFRAGLDRAARALEGRLEAAAAERATFPHRAAMHEFYLRLIAGGRISAFALTEPSAGSDTARIRTKAEPVEVEAFPEPQGYFTFTPAGGGEPRNLFPIDRCTFVDGRPHFRPTEGAPVPIEIRDFAERGAEGPARLREVDLGGRRVVVHDFGRVVPRDGRFFYPYFRVNGQKMWITNGSVAGVMSLYARTSRGPTGFMLDAHQEGLVVGKDEEKMGQRGSATNELALKDVRIPIDAVVGIEGRGQENALETLNVGRAGLAATCVGMMHEVFADVRAEFARTGREPSPADLLDFGKAAIDLAGAESLAYQLVGRFDHRGTKSIRIESALGKAETSEALHRLLTRAERATGAATILADSLLEKRRRDARVLTIYEGTNEIQRFLVLKDLVDAIALDAPPPPAPLTTSAGVAAGLRAVETARGEIFRRTAEIRARLGSKSWQDVSLQPWMFRLVESYAAVAVLAATVRRAGLAARLVRDDRGRPRLEYLERALKLMAKAATELPQGRLAEFDREGARILAGRDPADRVQADRALLAHAAREEAPEPAPPTEITRRLRVLALVDPTPATAPEPRLTDGRQAETWFELTPADRATLRQALAWKSAGEVDVVVVGAGGPLAAGPLREATALGADRAVLIDIGRRALLAADLAAFLAEWVRVDEDLHGPFDLVLGADAHAGLLLPLARRLDVEAVRGATAIGADAGEAGAAFVLRLEKPRASVAVRGPAAATFVGAVAPHEFAATIEGFRRAASLGVQAIEFEPREAAEGRLRAVPRHAGAAAASVAGGPLDADAAAAAFASAAGLTGGAATPAEPYAGDLVAAEASAWAEVGAAAVALVGADGAPPPAIASWLAGARALAGGKPVGALLVAKTADEAILRRAAGAVAGPGVRVALLADEALGAFSDARLGRALEAALSGVSGSVIYGPELRGAALTAGEGRAKDGGGVVLVDGIDRVEICGHEAAFSGTRLEGRARYAVTRPWSSPAHLVARGELAVTAGDAPGDASPPRVLRFPAPAATPDDELARALRAAAAELGVESLADAEFILDVGYGVGSRDGLEEVVEPMRVALRRLGVEKISIGASRKVTQDLGLLPDAVQIGQTGVSVNPRVLIALGVSGAPQHLNYIGERAVIFAFNKDPEAPLMTLNRSRPRPVVHPIVGDLFVEAPKFLRALERETARTA